MTTEGAAPGDRVLGADTRVHHEDSGPLRCHFAATQAHRTAEASNLWLERSHRLDRTERHHHDD